LGFLLAKLPVEPLARPVARPLLALPPPVPVLPPHAPAGGDQPHPAETPPGGQPQLAEPAPPILLPSGSMPGSSAGRRAQSTLARLTVCLV
jgi:hypothetical protein